MRLTGGVEERLLARLHFSDGCWTWTGAISPAGYGRAKIRGRVDYMHRFAVEWTIGRRLRVGEQIDHLCRDRRCARPSHLEIVTAAENTRRGATAKLTWPEVLELRRRRASGETTVALGLAFGVHSSEVSRICNGQIWVNASATRARKAAGGTGSLFGKDGGR